MMTRVPKEWAASLALVLAALIGDSGRPARGQSSLFAPPPAPRLPATPSVPTREAPAPPRPLAVQVEAITRRASAMTAKGMLFAAREELVESLRLVAQAIDDEHKTRARGEALAAGLTALEEAGDFAPGAGDLAATVDVGAIARSHRTPILKETQGLSPVVAQQHYLQFAREQLTAAVTGEPTASQALFALGKIQSAIAGPATPSNSLHGPRAIVFYQAALAVDAANYLAANELGVLLARYGQWEDAKRALLHSVSVRPHAEGWQNLATVHRQLGETELARLAENERQLIAARPTPRMSAGGVRTTWIDPRQFAAQSAAQERR
jgi:tetratricopeptide (TPR) repeat protein